MQALPPAIPSAIREKYFRIFGSLYEKASKEGAHTKVIGFSNYLKNSQKNLKLIMEPVINAANAYRTYLDNFAVFSEMLMPEFETNVVEGYFPPECKDHLVFSVAEGDVHVRGVELRNQLANAVGVEQVADIFRNEWNENEAMMKAIEDRGNVETSLKKLEDKRNSLEAEKGKLKSGKSTLKSFFSKGSKEDQVVEIERQLTELKREIDSSQEILNLLTVVMAEIEIAKYKDRKLRLYLRAIQDASVFELNYVIMYRDYVRALGEQNETLAQQATAHAGG